MKLLRVWVPDPQAPGFREEAHRQALLLRNAPEERDALEFIEAAADRWPTARIRRRRGGLRSAQPFGV